MEAVSLQGSTYLKGNEFKVLHNAPCTFLDVSVPHQIISNSSRQKDKISMWVIFNCLELDMQL